MKISLNWLKKYAAVPESVSDEELIRLIGARLVEVEGVIDEMHKYDNIYIVRVESCEKIPETHLTLCRINAGEALSGTSGRDSVSGEASSALVQVVCGAPNVHAGMLAVWIAPGAVVPASVHEDAPFVIGKRKMQGYESNGMLAGADELDFGDDHSGIVEIDPDMAKPGDLLADVFELNDKILEIENKSLTHRPDCFGIIGFAREVAGILGRQFEYNFSGTGSCPPVVMGVAPFAITGVTSEAPRKMYSKSSSSIKVSIDGSGICPRYSAVVMTKHGEIKKQYLTWIDTVLSKSGMRPVGPIVDATNYLMLLTGQPLHAFDYDKFVVVGKTDKPEIRIRLARKGEKLVLLDDSEVELSEDDIVICSADTPVALAGAMGGKSTEISEDTRNIIIESATFSLYNLRKTQMAHGIFSEAITRFTKGQSPYQTLAVAEACAEMLLGGFELTSIVDEYPEPVKDIVVKITTNEINLLLGTQYSAKLIEKTLSNVGFSVSLTPSANGKIDEKSLYSDVMSVAVPAWRTDIHIKENIIEEVGRLLGYDNIQHSLPLHKTASKNTMWELKKKIRGLLVRYGANEVLTYSFVSGRLLERVGQKVENSYRIINSISPELQYVRQSLLPSLLEKTYLNEKLPVSKFAIFEMNKVYCKEWGMNDESVPVERMSLALVVAERKNNETAFYKAKKYAAKVLEELNIKAEFLSIKTDRAEARLLEQQRSAEIVVDGEYIGVVGEFKNSVRNELKLAPYVAGVEFDMGQLLKYGGACREIDLAARKKEDVTITTDKTYGETLAGLSEQYPDAIIEPGTIYQAPGQKTKNITFHISRKVQ